MASLYSRYSPLLDSAPRLVASGSQISADQVYYECRKVEKVHSFEEVNDKAGKVVLYRGKLNHSSAKCVDTDGKQAIAGMLIGFVCSEQPDEPQVYQTTGTHKGQAGCIGGSVVCRIVMKYANIPDPPPEKKR